MLIASRTHFVNFSLECIVFYPYFMFGMVRTQMELYLMRNNEDSDTYFL